MASGFIPKFSEVSSSRGSEDWITMSAHSVTMLVLPGAWKCATCLMIKTPQTWRNACMWLKRRWVTHDSWALSCVLLLTDIDMVDINCSVLTSQVMQDFVHQQHEYNMIWIHQLYCHMSLPLGWKTGVFVPAPLHRREVCRCQRQNGSHPGCDECPIQSTSQGA